MKLPSCTALSAKPTSGRQSRSAGLLHWCFVLGERPDDNRAQAR